MYPAFIFFFYQLIIPLRIAFLPINNITIIYFFCSRSSNSLFPALKIKFCFFCFVFSFFFFFFFTKRIVCRLSFSVLFMEKSPTGLNKRNKCIKNMFSCWRKQDTVWSQWNRRDVPPSVPETWKCFFFFFFPSNIFVLRGGERFGCSSISIGRFFCTSSLSGSSHATIVLLSFLFFFFLSMKAPQRQKKKIGAFVVPRPTCQEIKKK